MVEGYLVVIPLLQVLGTRSMGVIIKVEKGPMSIIKLMKIDTNERGSFDKLPSSIVLYNRLVKFVVSKKGTSITRPYHLIAVI